MEIQVFRVSYGGKNYTVTTQELPETLSYWREVLRSEGAEPNEGTIDLVNQLELIEKTLKKQAKERKAQAQTHTQKPTPPTNDDYETLLHLDGTSIALICIAVFLISTVSTKKNSPNKNKGLILNGLGTGENVTYYDSAEDFNLNHPK